MRRDSKTCEQLAFGTSNGWGSSAPASPVRTSRVRDASEGSKARDKGASDPDSGKSAPGWLAKSGRGPSWSKTLRAGKVFGSRKFGATSKLSATERVPLRFLPPKSERGTSGEESSLWPTLTTARNMLSPDSQKWPAHRRLLSTRTASRYGSPNNGTREGVTPYATKGKPSLDAIAGGSLCPRWCEWFMGFPDGWTDDGAELSAMPLFPDALR